MKITQTIRELFKRQYKNYTLCIYHGDNKVTFLHCMEFGQACKAAKVESKVGEQYEIQCYQDGRYLWSTGKIAGGLYGRRPRKPLLY